MNDERMSKEQQESQEPTVEQTGKVTDEVLDAVSGGVSGFNPDGTARPPDGWDANISFN